ncbi:bifunctional nuclease family protein [candidate division WWE3 bacterium]|nr:bifunctional nuclease family protein [candidate division WWE3 bacterium]
MLEFKLAAIMPRSESKTKQSTIYLFNRQQSLLLPLELPESVIQQLIQTIKIDKIQPHICVVIKRVVNLLKAQFECVILQDFINELFYSYIRLMDDKKNTYDFRLKVSDAILMAFGLNIPILVTEKVLKNNAYKITKELLEQFI